MPEIKEKYIPKTRDDFILTLENICILKNYQLFLRENLSELRTSFPAVQPARVFKFIMKTYYGNERLKNTIRLKNAYNTYLRDWEHDTKLKISDCYRDTNLIAKLRRVGTALKAIKNRVN
jgi:hypothetical protein